MGLGRERFFSLQHSSEHLAPLSQNGEVFHEENTPFSDSQEQRRLGEVKIKLAKEPGEEELQEAHRLEDNDGFEPFTDPCNKEGDQFINLYGGNFSQNMELNREAVERILEIAHLDGQVLLTSRSSASKSSIDNINPDSSVTAKKSLFAGQQIRQKEDKGPDYRVVNVEGRGWDIEINDQGITDELREEKRLSGDSLKKAFIERFNGIVNDGIFESIRKEKLSGEKDKYFKGKVFVGLFPILLQTVAQIPSSTNHPFFATLFGVGYVIGIYGLFNASGELIINRIIKNLNLSLGRFPLVRPNFDSFCEYLMPPVEIDKVARAFAFLKIKGRKLVKEKGID